MSEPTFGIAALAEENRKLRAELAAEREKAFTAMRVFERYRELEATIAKLREALEPFADDARFFIPKAPDNNLAAPNDLDITIGHLRRARTVLEETK